MGKIKIKQKSQTMAGNAVVEGKTGIKAKRSGNLKEPPKVLYEDKTKREANVKHFRMSDGSYRAEIYNEPIHYYDAAEGKYLAIDNTLCDCPACSGQEDDFDGYENRQSDIKVKFGKRTGGGKLLSLRKGQYGVEWRLSKGTAKARMSENDSLAELLHGAEEKERLSDEIRYNDVFTGTDLQYVVSSVCIKENIIVKERRENYEYEFELKLKNLDIELSEDERRLNLYTTRLDENSGASSKEIVFTIPMPYMYDAKGERSSEVEYELEEQGGGYLFKIKADEAWINAEERVFPVVIDPAIETIPEQECLSRTVVDKKDIHGNYIGADASGRRFIGNDYDNPKARTYLKFFLNQLYEKKIINAKLLLWQSGCVHESMEGEVNYFEVHKVVSFWNENTTMTWENCPSFSSEVYACQKYQWRNNIQLEIDITKLVKEWETEPNYGILLKGVLESSDHYNSIIIESERSIFPEDIEERMPQLIIEYIEERALKSEEYQINNVKRAGTHMLDLWTGHNRFVHEDGNFDESLRLSVDISHIYNYLDRKNEYIETSRGHITPTLGTGRGWKLNVQQYVYPVSDSAAGYTDNLRYLYIDQNGDEIPFVASKKNRPVYDSSGNITAIGETEEYLDEQGKNLRCIPDGDEIRIEDNKGTVLYFHDNELYKITDRNGDTIVIERNACGGKISKVSDSLGHTATFYYSSSCERINRIVFSDGRSLQYSYDAYGRLREIVYPDGESTEFYYGSNPDIYSLTSVRDMSGYRLKIGYANGKVSSLRDYASNREISSSGVTAYKNGDSDVASFQSLHGSVYEKAGKELLFRYAENRTTVVTENGYGDNYQFDNTGFCACRYETSDELSASGTENKKKITGIASYKSFDAFGVMEVRPSALAENYLSGGSFEGLADYNQWEKLGTAGSTYYSSSVSASGNFSLMMESSVEGERKVRQTITKSALNLTAHEGLILMGCAKADALPPNDATKFRLYAEIIYTDNSSDTVEVPFDYLQTGWQFAAKGFRIEKLSELQSVQIYAEYSHNSGTAYFDDIRLVKGDAIYTLGSPQFYTNRDSETYGIEDLTKIKYRDTDHLFSKNETEDVTNAKKLYMDILSMQENRTMIILNGEVIDDGADPKKTKLVFSKNGQEKEYSLFDIDYAASGITEIVNKSGKVRLYKNKYDDVEKTVLVDNDGNEFTSTSEYDAQHRLIKETDFRGVVTEYTYSSSQKYNNVTWTKRHYNNQMGKTLTKEQSYYNNSYVRYVHDERGVDDQGSTIRTKLNYSSIKDRLESVELPNGQTITYSYDTTNTYLLGIEAKVSARQTPGGALQTQTAGANYSYTSGYLTKIEEESGGTEYGYIYDGFGNLKKTLVNGAEVLSVERYRDSTYSSADESTYNYEEIELANGTKIKEITDKAGRVVCRKIREKTGESNGASVYGAETESYRVVYKTDANGETLDEIDYTLDKMPAIEAGTPETESLWTKREYHYKENGEIDYVSRRGKWTGLEREERDAGERVTKEIYSVSEIYMSQTYGYEYEAREGAVIPDNRIKRMVMYGDATGSHQTETTEYSYDELGRVTKREYIGNKSVTSAYLYETYSYRPRKGLNICHQAEESGSTNYVSGIQYRCGSETGTEFAEYDRNGNISRIQLGTMITTYKYDGIDRLTEEENGFILKTSHYGYDGSGNIREVYTKAKNGAAWETREAYQYDANHPDRLTKITTYDLTNNTSSEKTIGNYDELGNPRSYKGDTLTWVRGRVLKSYGNKASYEYDGENIRQKKTEGGRTHEYYTGIDGRILGERVTENGIQTMYRYMYEGEQVIGLVKNGTEVYHYQYGTSGDIVRICDAQGSVVARYNYDA